MQARVLILITGLIALAAKPGSVPMSVCKLSRDFARFQDKVVTIRGVYYYGLRQQCPGKCAYGVWPSFIELRGGTDRQWAPLENTLRQVEAEAKQTGKRFEIWVTISGVLTPAVSVRLWAPAIALPGGTLAILVRSRHKSPG